MRLQAQLVRTAAIITLSPRIAEGARVSGFPVGGANLSRVGLCAKRVDSGGRRVAEVPYWQVGGKDESLLSTE